jgi:hypothetical protein
VKILAFILENFMRVRVVEIRPTNRITTITGRNGQGKTSTLTGLFATLQGKYATPDAPVRKGAKNAKGQILLGDKNGDQLIVERIINPDRSTTLKLRPARNGRPTGEDIRNPQTELDKLFGEMARDPLEFIALKPKEQIEVLRTCVKLDVDLDEIAADNKRDFDERTGVNKEIRRLQTVLQGMVVQDGLPKEKVDEHAILQELNLAGQKNREAQGLDAKRAELQRASEASDRKFAAMQEDSKAIVRHMEDLRKQLEMAEINLRRSLDAIQEYERVNIAAAQAYLYAPQGELVDVGELSQKLQLAQLTNREIDKRERRDKVEAELREFERDASSLSRRIEDRDERKARAMAEAKMPVDGLTFNEELVLFKGIPLQQLGEAEQLRVSAQIMMAGNPTLRVLPIWRGEALDEENVEMLRAVAEEQDFDVWMVKVDASGKTGIVIEDGEVKAVNA